MQDVWIGDGDASAAFGSEIDAGSVGSYLRRQARKARKSARKVARAVAPVTAIASELTAQVPGLGSVAAPLAAAAALGRGASLRDATLAAARASLPPQAAAAFDVAAGMIASGKPPSAIDLARAAMPPAARAAFDRGREAAALAARAPRMIGQPPAALLAPLGRAAATAARGAIGLAPGAESVARAILATPALRSLPVGELARATGATTHDAREAIASVARAVARGPSATLAPARELARRVGAHTTADGAIAALAGRPRHMMIPAPLQRRRLSRAARAWASRLDRRAALLLASGSADAAGLDATGRIWIVESGDYPSKIAKIVTGDANRWRELRGANPSKAIDPATGNFKSLLPGERLALPDSWIRVVATPPTATPPAAPPPPPPTTTTATPPAAPPPPPRAEPPTSPPIVPAIAAPDPRIGQALTRAWVLAERPPGVDYGSRSDDLDGLASNRRWLWALDAFRRWTNSRRSPWAAKLAIGGPYDDATAAALAAWAEARAAKALAPPAPPAPPVPPSAPPGVSYDVPPGLRAAPPPPPPPPTTVNPPPAVVPGAAPPPPPPPPPATTTTGGTSSSQKADGGIAPLLVGLGLAWSFLR